MEARTRRWERHKQRPQVTLGHEDARSVRKDGRAGSVAYRKPEGLRARTGPVWDGDSAQSHVRAHTTRDRGGT